MSLLVRSSLLALALAAHVCPVRAQSQTGPTTTDLVQQLTAILADNGTDEYRVPDACRLLGRLGPAALPAAGAIVKRVGVWSSLQKEIDYRASWEPIPSAAAEALGRMGRGVLPVLTDALRNREPLVRWVAVRALGNLGTDARAAIPALKFVILNDRADDSRVGYLGVEDEALRVIARLGVAGLPTLTELSQHVRLDIRSRTLDALYGYTGAPGDAVRLLLQGLRDPELHVRQQALFVIDRIKPPQADVRSVVQRTAEQDSDQRTREIAAGVLERPLTLPEFIRSFCIHLTGVNDQDYWLNATRWIAMFGEAARLELLRIAEAVEDAGAECAWDALTRLGDRRVIPALRSALQNEKVRYRSRFIAIHAVARFGDRQSVGYLIRLLQTDDFRLAAEALGAIDSEEARAGLRAALESTHWSSAVIDAIGTQRDAAAVPLLREAAGYSSTGHSDADLTRALARIGTPDAIDLLEEVVRRMPPGENRRWTSLETAVELTLTLARTKDRAVRRRIDDAIHIMLAPEKSGGLEQRPL